MPVMNYFDKISALLLAGYMKFVYQGSGLQHSQNYCYLI